MSILGTLRALSYAKRSLRFRVGVNFRGHSLYPVLRSETVVVYC